jgi:hypothetical protein
MVVPALCFSGAFLHHCECETSIDCAHEEGCGDDPCTDLVIRQESGGSHPVVGAVREAPVVSWAAVPPGPAEPAPVPETSRPCLARPPADLPLLI